MSRKNPYDLTEDDWSKFKAGLPPHLRSHFARQPLEEIVKHTRMANIAADFLLSQHGLNEADRVVQEGIGETVTAEDWKQRALAAESREKASNAREDAAKAQLEAERARPALVVHSGGD